MTDALAAAPGVREQVSTRIMFFIAGFGMAAWAPLIPFAKARTGVDAGELGLLLLCLGLGSIATMPAAGALAARFGCRRVFTGATLALCLALPVLASASRIPLLAAGMLLFGASIGAIDVTANIQAIIVERASGRVMMSGFHGLFSLGGMAGAAGLTVLLGLGTTPLVATLGVVGGILAALLAGGPAMLPYGGQSDGPMFALPRGIVLFIGVICCIVFLTEGAVLDWSAVFLSSVRDVPPAYAGFGYAVFASTMTAGRLLGDRVVERHGQTRVIVAGATCAATGFALAALVPSWAVALLGYALVGIGCSNIVPVLFTSVGRQKVMPESVAVPAITTLGYAGIIAGPAVIGFLARAISLPAAFLTISALLLAVAGAGRLLRA
ncbi:MAG: MFS transporter [Rhodospirillales bacterium]|nr:MFS transporter [Rhodospirillales bacterium]